MPNSSIVLSPNPPYWFCFFKAEAVFLLSNKRSHRSEEPMHRNEKVVLLATTKEKPTQQRRHSAAINK